MTKQLQNYLKKKSIVHTVQGGYLCLGDKKYLILDEVQLDDKIENVLCEEPCVYFFCGRWYLQESEEGIDGKELMNIGEGDFTEPNFAFLGVHGNYEIMNGVGTYKQWVKKAKFMGVEALGLCEENTLSGTISFQKECLKNDIRPVLGMSLKYKRIYIKLYIKNYDGWQELLKISNRLSYNEDIDDLVKDISNNLIVVVDPKKMKYEDVILINRPDYYQLDGVSFSNSADDKEFLENLELFVNSDIRPVAITDAYYTEKEYADAKYLLNTINKSFGDNINNQYFKSNDEYIYELKEIGIPFELSLTAVDNQGALAQKCQFLIDTTTWHLPKYDMTPDEATSHPSNEEYFMYLIKKGIVRLNLATQTYLDRVKKEIAVLNKGGFIDYFLILHDIMRYSKEQNMLVGLARGSAAGSLIAYLLDITKIDPLEFELIFERFLNEGRIPQPKMVDALVINEKETFHNNEIVKVKRNGKELFTMAKNIKIGDQLL